MKRYIFAAGLILSVAIAVADDAEARTKLNGTWQATDQAVWTFAEASDGLKITHKADNRDVDFACNTMGKECKFKNGAKTGTVSMWFSGPKLIQLETFGKDVVKRRFGVSADGKTLEVEVIPVVPPGNAETFKFARADGDTQPTSASASTPTTK